MSLDNSAVVPFTGGAYEIGQSLRFNQGDSAYLSRTISSASNRKTFTISVWVKLGEVGNIGQIFGLRSGSSYTLFYYVNDFLTFSTLVGGSGDYYAQTDALYRDPSAWYHIVCAVDTTQSTQANRVKFYVNGELQSQRNNNYPQNQDTYINSTLTDHQIGRQVPYGDYWDGYMAEFNFVDGQQLDPTNFGETDETYGHWKPIEYTGSYGTNGFYLDFDGTYYNDKSGNGNNWTANNLSTTDVVVDSPTNNFTTFNPLDSYNGNTYSVFSEGNLKRTYAVSGSDQPGWSNIGVSSGKWYVEFAYITSGYLGSTYTRFGVTNGITWDSVGNNAKSYGYRANGSKYNNGTETSYGSSYTTGDIIGIALDMDGGTLTFYKNGTSQGTAFSSLSGEFFFGAAEFQNSVIVVNFGQDSSFAGNKTAQGNTDDNSIGDFYYTPPSGYLALCTANLDDPAVIPSENFAVNLWTGNDTERSITTGFQPDFVWTKYRSVTGSHQLHDSVRGATKRLYSNLTNAEDSTNGLVSFDSNGFTMGDDSTSHNMNGSGYTAVGWSWKAGNSSGSSNTDGTITSTVSANQDAGFSIVSYTGDGSGTETVGHGLNSTPEMIMVKDRDSTSGGWMIYHHKLSDPSDVALHFLASGEDNHSGYWGDTDPTSSVFSVSYYSGQPMTNNTNDYIAYCFHSVDGYSKVGSYTGNGSTDGPFVYTGFRAAFVMIKPTYSSYSWIVYDNKRVGYNPDNKQLFPDASDSEVTSIGNQQIDILSNGFKLNLSNPNYNSSGNNIIYIAFAEYPFKYTNAR